MTFRLLGIPDELRVEIEQATGMTTRAAQLIIETSVNQAEQILESGMREIQTLVGPHGSVSRLQAGGIKISQGMGIRVYADGVQKTTILPNGDFVVGSDVTDPATTTFACFVESQTYNNELMGAGDLLFGDNTSGISNVKLDASTGQLQFRYGKTVQAYMDTDGSIKAGAGVVTLDTDGVSIDVPTSATDTNSYKFVNGADLVGGLYGYRVDAQNFWLLLRTINAAAVGQAFIHLYAEGVNLGNIRLTAASSTRTNRIDITQNETHFNVNGENTDTYISGDTDTNLLYADASTDRVGIGTATPSTKLDVNGGINIATGSTYDINGSPHSHAALGTAFQRVLTSDLTLNDGECLVVTGYLDLVTYDLTLDGDSILEIL